MTRCASLIAVETAKRFRTLLPALLLLTIGRAPLRAQDTTIELDPSQSRIEYTLKSNVDTVHGTFKLKSGIIHFDPSTGKISGSIVVDATSGESGNDSRDKRMHSLILDSKQYPEIIFTPNKLSGTFSTQAASKVEVSGQFTLHGQEHDVTFPLDIQPAPQKLQMTTQIALPYLQWGLKNPNRFGILRVSDKVDLNIRAVGKFGTADFPIKK